MYLVADALRRIQFAYHCRIIQEADALTLCSP